MMNSLQSKFTAIAMKVNTNSAPKRALLLLFLSLLMLFCASAFGVEAAKVLDASANETAEPNFWKFFLYAFLGGLILNVMPCVIPVVIPKIGHLVRLGKKAKSGTEGKRVIFLNSLAYAAGVWATMLGLAVAIILLQQVGEKVGWGFQFQNLYFLIFMVSILFALGFGMLEVFSLKVETTDIQRDIKKKRRKTPVLESFLTGLLVTFLGTPCTAPMLGPALGYALSQPPGIILLFFSAIALGLAFPFLVLGVWTGWTKPLPERFDNPTYNRGMRGMAFLLFATGVWLLYVIMNTYGALISLRVMIFLLLIAFGAWLLGLIAPAGVSLKRKIISYLSVVAVLFLSTIPLFSVDEKKETIDWVRFYPGVIKSLKNTRQPIFVDFTADWCANCKANENLFINTMKTKTLLEKLDYVAVQADFTKGSDAISNWLERFGRSGVPMYLVIPPCAEKNEDILLLPEILTDELLHTALKKAALGGVCKEEKDAEQDDDAPDDEQDDEDKPDEKTGANEALEEEE